VQKPVHGSQNLGRHVASAGRITEAVRTIYDRITDGSLLMRRFNVAVGNLLTADELKARESVPEQLDLLTDYEARDAARAEEDAALEKETRRQKALLSIRDKYGKNAVVKGLNLQEGATAIERNAQIGGHKA
jgi:DNA polymerase V